MVVKDQRSSHLLISFSFIHITIYVKINFNRIKYKEQLKPLIANFSILYNRGNLLFVPLIFIESNNLVSKLREQIISIILKN